MKSESNSKQWKSSTLDWLLLSSALLITIVLLSLFPSRLDDVGTSALGFSLEMFSILPAVMLLTGLFSVWVSREMVIKFLGKSAGIKGVALSLFFGSLPTGPLYIAFPLAAGLLNKGARISNVIIFLTAWACIKIPQEMVELQFLGTRFMIVRLSFTIIAAILMGLLIERIVVSREKYAKSKGE